MAIEIRCIDPENPFGPPVAVMYDAADDSRDCVAARELTVCKALGVELPDGESPMSLAPGYYTEDEQYFLPNWVDPQSRLEAFMDWMLLTTGSLEYERLWPEFVEYERANLVDLYAQDITPFILRFGVRIDRIHDHAKTFDPDRQWMVRAINEWEGYPPEYRQFLRDVWIEVDGHDPIVGDDED